MIAVLLFGAFFLELYNGCTRQHSPVAGFLPATCCIAGVPAPRNGAGRALNETWSIEAGARGPVASCGNALERDGAAGIILLLLPALCTLM